MFFTLDVKTSNDDWMPVTVDNINQLMGFLGPETTIRNFKAWGGLT